MSSPRALLVAELPDAGHFAAPVCRNCGAALATRFCGACGQERAKRFGLRSVRNEAWQNWRWFEWEVLASAWRLLTQPGTVAREYVLGARKKHVHPLKLLLFAIGAMVLVVGQSSYFASAEPGVSPAMELVRSYSNWSFSLGIIAILASSWLVFRRYGGFNLTEHLVLATYCLFLIICASVLSKLPTLVWRTPEFLALHKLGSAWFLQSVGIVVVITAFKQFFLLDPQRSWRRLAVAGAVYVTIKWCLQTLYGITVVKIVLAQLA